MTTRLFSARSKIYRDWGRSPQVGFEGFGAKPHACVSCLKIPCPSLKPSHNPLSPFVPRKPILTLNFPPGASGRLPGAWPRGCEFTVTARVRWADAPRAISGAGKEQCLERDARIHPPGRPRAGEGVFPVTVSGSTVGVGGQSPKTGPQKVPLVA